ncbi:MAG: DUF417 family protein [Bacteroidota bacterium]|nr:DUF417 family protein [Bacteroidota bacterium]
MEKARIQHLEPNAWQFERAGAIIIRYGLAIVLIWIGCLKFTMYEAEGVKPLAENSPFLKGLLGSLRVAGFAQLLGFVEIATGLLICCRPFLPKLSFFGSLAAIVTFLITLTFLLSTPGIIQAGQSFPFISPMPGQFILKDLVLLGASVWTAGEALAAARKN